MEVVMKDNPNRRSPASSRERLAGSAQTPPGRRTAPASPSLLSPVVALLLACGAGACGDDNAPLGVSNVLPSGTVGGLVIDAATQKPMAGVKVVVLAGGVIYPSQAPAVSDSNGFFSIRDVPAGEVIVQLTPEGDHLAATIASTLPNAAGEFPLGNATLTLGPIGLVPVTSDRAFRAQLITADGAPAPQITAYLRTTVGWIDFQSGKPQASGATVTEATSCGLGMVKFAGMPDFFKLAGLVGTGGISDLLRVQIPPYDTNGDGVLDFLGKEVIFHANRLQDTMPTIVLSSSFAPKLEIQASNIAALMGIAGNRLISSLSGPINIAFNWPIKHSLTEITVYDEVGVQIKPAYVVADVSANLMTIKFVGNALQAEAEYNLTMNAFAVAEGVLVRGLFGAPFFTAAPANTKVNATLASAGMAGDGSPIIAVTFSEPVGTGVAGESLTGASSVLFFDFDLDGSGKIGDAISEAGHSTSAVGLINEEPTPPGAAGKSGLSTRWSFTAPLDFTGNPVPAGKKVNIVFSRAGVPVERANGQLANDILGLVLPD